MKKKSVNPYTSSVGGINENSDKPILRKNEIAAEMYFSGNEKVAPEAVTKWVADETKKAKEKGYKNLRIEPYQHDADDDNLESNYLRLRGDRMETENECRQRVGHVVGKWQRDYEEFLRRLMFYRSDMGQAQINEVKKANQRPIWSGYPGSPKSFIDAVAEERRQLEK